MGWPLSRWADLAKPFHFPELVLRVRALARLKRKLGEPQPIQTTPGIGYKIPAECS